jgi:acetyl-CoA acetyltransferase
MEDTQDVYDAADLQPPEIDVVLLYDAFTFTAALQLEGLGFCPRGEWGAYIRENRDSILAKLNPNGGLLGQAHVSGINNLIEGVRQLNGTAGDRQLARAETALFSGWASYSQYTILLSQA